MLKFLIFIGSKLPRPVLVFFYDATKCHSQRLFIGLRYCILKSLCKVVGQKVIIGTNVTIKNWEGISMGDNVSIQDGSYLDGYGGISIGSNVSIAHHCSLLSTSHTWADPTIPIRINPVENRPLVIMNNVWLGCAVRVMGGVYIERDVIVGAGSIVTKKLAPNGIYMGAPAKFYKAVYPVTGDTENLKIEMKPILNG